MTLTLNKPLYKFVGEVPVMGAFVGDDSVAASGQIVIRGLPHRTFVPFTSVATIGLSPNLYARPDAKTVASGNPVFEIHKIHVPSIEDLLPEWRREAHVPSKPTKQEIARMQIDNFLSEVYRLALIDADGATDRVFDFIDRVLCDGLFAVCDEVLRKVNVEQLTTSLMRSFLAITDAAKYKLPSRKTLYLKIEAKMKAMRGTEKTSRIIGNLA